ncbi:hypothetical protein GCM10028796_50980 [Ramlibacter monticola]|uniref:Uncharacterized protein n=1 Tax=Ramlibacter monticola TaxID=1926872 RepID=A0A936Z9Q3_9BURK|nr:hypothetical protein [Ramlibacter monticola]MBL0395301.1 hypothetical protein [Ramlibacter monticola]
MKAASESNFAHTCLLKLRQLAEGFVKVEKSVAYTCTNIEDVRTLPVALPALAEQIEIV